MNSQPVYLLQEHNILKASSSGIIPTASAKLINQTLTKNQLLNKDQENLFNTLLRKYIKPSEIGENGAVNSTITTNGGYNLLNTRNVVYEQQHINLQRNINQKAHLTIK